MLCYEGGKIQQYSSYSMYCKEHLCVSRLYCFFALGLYKLRLCYPKLEVKLQSKAADTTHGQVSCAPQASAGLLLSDGLQPPEDTRILYSSKPTKWSCHPPWSQFSSEQRHQLQGWSSPGMKLTAAHHQGQCQTLQPEQRLRV